MDADTARHMILTRQAELLAAKRPVVIAHPSPFPIGVRFGPSQATIVTQPRRWGPDNYAVRGSDAEDAEHLAEAGEIARHNARILAEHSGVIEPEPAEEIRQVLAPVAHLLGKSVEQISRRERASLAKRLKKAIRMKETYAAAGMDLDSPLSFDDWYANRVDARSLVCSFV